MKRQKTLMEMAQDLLHAIEEMNGEAGKALALRRTCEECECEVHGCICHKTKAQLEAEEAALRS